TALANFAAVAIERARLHDRVAEEKRIRGRLERYHSPQVVDEIIADVKATGSFKEVRTETVTILLERAGRFDVGDDFVHDLRGVIPLEPAPDALFLGDPIVKARPLDRHGREIRQRRQEVEVALCECADVQG